MKNGEPQLGVITKVTLGMEDHGIWTFFLFFDFGGSGQGFGGFCLDEWHAESNRRLGTAAGMDAMMRICYAAGVREWSDLSGRSMFVEREGGWNGSIIAIEAPPFIKGGGRFSVKEWRDAWFPEVETS